MIAGILLGTLPGTVLAANVTVLNVPSNPGAKPFSLVDWFSGLFQGGAGYPGPQGPAGPAGEGVFYNSTIIYGSENMTPGTSWYNGPDPPGTGIGFPGDYFLTTGTSGGMVYNKTDLSTWTWILNITGPTGPQGPKGDQGDEGDPGIVDYSLVGSWDLSNRTAIEGEILSNRTAIEEEIATNLSAAKAYTDTNATNWLSVTARRFAFSNYTVLTSGTQFVLNSSTTSVLLELQATGGGGGGVSGSTSNTAGAGGGGAGGHGQIFRSVASGATLIFNVTGGGAGGASGGANPGANGYPANVTITGQSWKLECTGGTGGTGQTYGTGLAFVSGGAGGTCSGGTLNGASAPGFWGHRESSTVAASGHGGSSFFGAGGVGRTSQGTGNAGTGYGAGGGGAMSSSSSYAGGAGSTGVLIVWEFI